MQGIVLASHGLLADGMLDTLKMFTGEQTQMESLCLLPEEDITDFMAKLTEKVDSVDSGDGVVVFCDLLFGTPCNCGARFLQDSQYLDSVSIVTGMNLPMVLEFVGIREAGINKEKLIEIGQDGIVDFNELYKKRAEEKQTTER